jgi:diaminopimelate epimerase
MGQPAGVRLATIDVDGASVDAVVLRVGNPQCVVLERSLDEGRYRRLGAALEHHPFFPEGTNVEFAQVESPGLVRILIWERGVGPTLASGTGACAAAVAAITYGGAARDVTVASPGGTQRVEWRDDGLYLTGWAEVVWEGRWTR